MESFKPEALPALCEQVATKAKTVGREIAEYDRLLSGDLEVAHRRRLEEERARCLRRLGALQARLNMLRSAQYDDDADAMLHRTLQVA
ncbi:MAG: hypothetical protein M3220_21460 [Chloroflexota bacterium]|nr:hypothetical protein [Chloroflexota bacterium]